MSTAKFSDLIPNAADLLALPVEEVAGVLLTHLNACVEEHIASDFNGVLNQHLLFGFLTAGYHGHERPVHRALLEAWSWLESQGLIARELDTVGSAFFITRRGKGLRSQEDFSAYRKGNLLPKHQLHSLIAGRVYPAFLRGEYDTAVFQAFREVEVAVRQAAQFAADKVGVQLMRAAFSKNGPLADIQLPEGEQDAMGHLFAGAFGVYRNSTGHRHVPTEPRDAAEVIMLASQLLRIVDRLKPQPAPVDPAASSLTQLPTDSRS